MEAVSADGSESSMPRNDSDLSDAGSLSIVPPDPEASGEAALPTPARSPSSSIEAPARSPSSSIEGDKTSPTLRAAASATRPTAAASSGGLSLKRVALSKSGSERSEDGGDEKVLPSVLKNIERNTTTQVQ